MYLDDNVRVSKGLLLRVAVCTLLICFAWILLLFSAFVVVLEQVRVIGFDHGDAFLAVNRSFFAISIMTWGSDPKVASALGFMLLDDLVNDSPEPAAQVVSSANNIVF